MHSLRKLALALGVLGLLAAVASPASAQSIQKTERCAIVSINMPEQADVVMTITTVDDQDAVDRAAGFCSEMIGNGQWAGIPNTIPPAVAGYTRLGGIGMSPDMSLNIWAKPDFTSLYTGYSIIDGLRDNGYPILTAS